MEHKSPALQRFEWLPGVATILAIAACYGTLLVITALPLLGKDRYKNIVYISFCTIET